jgi:hypothetical protein
MELALGLGSQENELFYLVFNYKPDYSFLVCLD